MRPELLKPDFSGALLPGWTYGALPDVDAACLDLLAEYVAWKGNANPPAGSGEM